MWQMTLNCMHGIQQSKGNCDQTVFFSLAFFSFFLLTQGNHIYAQRKRVGSPLFPSKSPLAPHVFPLSFTPSKWHHFLLCLHTISFTLSFLLPLFHIWTSLWFWIPWFLLSFAFALASNFRCYIPVELVVMVRFV